MKHYLTGVLILITFTLSAQEQRINFIIEINDHLLTGLTTLEIEVDSKKYLVNYYPGEFTIPDSLYLKIINDSLKFNVNFDYYDHSRKKSHLLNVNCDLSWFTITQPYQILKVYDLRDKQYRKWYGNYTDEDYLCELRIPNSGIWIRQK